MEHIHTLPEPWQLEDDFNRVLAWQSMGVDDILDISVPWSQNPDVRWKDRLIPAGGVGGDARHPVMVREYDTPSGRLRHAVRQTGEEQGPGWVVQPDHVALMEDFNIPRGIEHAVSSPDDVRVVRHLYGAPDMQAKKWFENRMGTITPFVREHGVAVQAWTAFGMDAVVWLTGVEGAVLMAIDHPAEFGRLVETVAATDYARTELACCSPDIDIIVQRGWYSSTDFWSPSLFEKFTYPRIEELARLVHRSGRKFAYTMTTGVESLGGRLADAGVDLLYFIDPVQDAITLERGRELLGDRMVIAGGINSVSLSSGETDLIRDEVQRALDILGPTKRFILQPVDALFPDTPWESVEAMVEAWREFC
jgi:hypothetical protein